MSDISYQQARRLGLKEVKARTARHEYPYLCALEETLPHLSSQNEQKLGTFRVDLEQVAGTYTASRGDAFSASFFRTSLFCPTSLSRESTLRYSCTLRRTAFSSSCSCLGLVSTCLPSQHCFLPSDTV